MVMENGKIESIKPISYNSTVIDASNESALKTLIDEYVPQSLLKTVIDTANNRVFNRMKHLEKRAVVWLQQKQSKFNNNYTL